MSLERQELTINGHTYTVMERYEEGHEITAGEASALNQTLRENVRNNLSKKEGLTQEAVDSYASEYQFGIRTAGTGGRTADPVMAEYMRLAKAKIKEMLKAKGKKADGDQITAAAKSMLNGPHGQPIWALAQQRVAEQQSLAADALDDIVAGIPEKAVEAPPAQPPAA
jgi:hypothetical protein